MLADGLTLADGDAETLALGLLLGEELIEALGETEAEIDNEIL